MSVPVRFLPFLRLTFFNSRSTTNCKCPLGKSGRDCTKALAFTGPIIEERPFTRSKSSSRNCLVSRCLCSTDEGEFERIRFVGGFR